MSLFTSKPFGVTVEVFLLTVTFTLALFFWWSVIVSTASPAFFPSISTIIVPSKPLPEATFSLEEVTFIPLAGVLTLMVVLFPSTRVTCVVLTENVLLSPLSSFLPQLNRVVATTAAVRIRVVVFIFTNFFYIILFPIRYKNSIFF